ncbi:MAG: 1-phosphofructokinase [Actinomycetota bacterium]
MIVTLTPNPSVDRTVEVDALVRGSVSRATGGRVDAGGKGINIAGALAAHGHVSIAVLPSGGWEGAQLAHMLEQEGIASVEVKIAGSIRANVTIAEPDGTITKLNEPGPPLAPAEIEALIQATIDTAVGAEWVVGCGSLPPGPADDFYALLVDRLARSNTRVAIDTSGQALLKCLSAGPDVIKPNLDELSEASRRSVPTLGDALDVANELREQGAGSVLASLGPHGALYVDDEHALHAEAAVDRPRSAVGAGDALLAGFLAHRGRGPEALASGVAWAAAAVSLPGSRMPGPNDVDMSAVRLHDRIDLDRSLNSDTRSYRNSGEKETRGRHE